MQREINEELSHSIMVTSPQNDIEPLSLTGMLNSPSNMLKKIQFNDKPEQTDKRQSRAFLFNQLKEQARIQEAEKYVDMHKQVQVLEVDEPTPEPSITLKQDKVR